MFTFEDSPKIKSILIASPFQIFYVIAWLKYLDLANLFQTSSKYERGSDNIIIGMLIGGTILRPVYYYLNRNQHKKILLDIHKLNGILRRNTRMDYVIDYNLLRYVAAILVNIGFIKVFNLLGITELKTGNGILGNVMFTFEDSPKIKSILIASPFQIFYVIAWLKYLDLANLFQTSSKYERGSDNIIIGMLIGGTILRPVYYYLNRNQHKKILLDIHKLNGILRRNTRMDYVIDYNLLRYVAAILVNIGFIKVFNLLGITELKTGNGYIFLAGLTSIFNHDLISRLISGEIRNQFKIINERIVTLQGDYDNIRLENYRKLVKLSKQFNGICILPQLVSLGLYMMLAIWEIHSGFLYITLKLPHYQYRIMFLVARIAVLLPAYFLIIESKTSVRNEKAQQIHLLDERKNELFLKDLQTCRYKGGDLELELERIKRNESKGIDEA
ncbi:hypothetical protein QE152_g36062 [Popillia japonica]|uniref:Gustatory receptor n=1 Tax=Popillia japonica TaxID=7064 RepID=A0AAW1IE56_POPJA